MPNSVTLVMAYYENAGMLVRHLDLWATYPPEIREALKVIVVDDGSPKAPAREAAIEWASRPSLDGCVHPQDLGTRPFPIDLQIYRMKIDVRWNQDACRNVGVNASTTPWLLLTDMDHMMPLATAERVVFGQLGKRKCYRFSRVSAPDNTPYKPHPNSWLMTRELYEMIGGYDERFAGYYGTDGDFVKRVQALAASVRILDEALIRVPREVVPDASTTTYGRKEKTDRFNVDRIKNEREKIPGWKPLRLTFEWERAL